MKQSISVLLLLALLLPLVCTLVACGTTPPAVDPPVTGTTPPEDPPVTPPVTTGGSGYDYTPYLPEKMPEVHVATNSGNESFATSITHIDQKWNNEIQYEGCQVSVSNAEAQYTMTDVPGEIKVRGNYTVMFPKQPFRIKFTEKQSMLGMNDGQAYKSWVLLAEWKDSSLLGDATAYYLGKTLLESDGYYCTDYRFVKLYLNEKYWGVYLLVEQQQTGTGRIDISEPAVDYLGTDIGYFIEYDGYYNMEPALQSFTIDHNNNAPFKDQAGNIIDAAYFRGYTIKSDINIQAQRDFIAKYIGNTYTALYRCLFTTTPYVVDENGDLVNALLAGVMSKRDAIERLIDVQSLVDTYILNEICCDYDLHWSSFYMSIDLSPDGNRKLTFEAPWDFDTAFGTKDSKAYLNPLSTKYSNKDACETGETPYAGVNRNPWLLLLMNEKWFMDMVKEKWAKLVEYNIPEKALRQITDATARYSAAFTENAERRWTKNGSPIYHVGDPCKELISEISSYRTHAEAAARLHDWLTIRFNYLNREWGNGKNLF